jgi:hypothetical protein
MGDGLDVEVERKKLTGRFVGYSYSLDNGQFLVYQMYPVKGDFNIGEFGSRELMTLYFLTTVTPSTLLE